MNMSKLKKQYLIVISISILCAVAITVLYSFQASPKRTNVIVIGYKSSDYSEFWKTLNRGIEAGAKEYEIEYEYVIPKHESSVEEQIELVYEAIEKKPDGIILIPVEYEPLSEAAEDIVKNGIELVCLDSDVNMDKRTLVATDNVAAGKELAQEVINNSDMNKYTLIVSHSERSSTLRNRIDGIVDVFEKNNVKYRPVVYAEYSNEDIYDTVYQAIKKDKTIGSIVTFCEQATTGAAEAVKFLGRQKEINIYGFDTSVSEIKMLEEDVIKAVISQKPFNMGYLAARAIYNKVHKGAGNENIVTDTVTVTADNIYDKDIQKSIFLFDSY